MRIFVTGATGFLGFHFVKEAIRQGHQVLCLRRPSSVSLFSPDEECRVKWVLDDENLQNLVNVFKPEVLFHAAWAGVRGTYRENRDVQSQNISLTKRFVCLYPYKQIICLGSQAEYGYYNGPVSENHEPSKLQSEYGATKLYCLNELKMYCEAHDIEWQWIRIFTVFGEQMTGGLIKLAIHQCLNSIKKFDTTKGEQKYSYLYAEDYAKAICLLLGSKGKSGIYNLSQPKDVYSNVYILSKIKSLMHSDIEYNFGSIPYTSNQIMYMDGDVSKFESAFGAVPHTNFETALIRTIDFYRK